MATAIRDVRDTATTRSASIEMASAHPGKHIRRERSEPGDNLPSTTLRRRHGEEGDDGDAERGISHYVARTT